MDKMYLGANGADRKRNDGNPGMMNMGHYCPPYVHQQANFPPVYQHHHHHLHQNGNARAIRDNNMAYNMQNRTGHMGQQRPVQPAVRNAMEQEVLLSPLVEPGHPIMQDSRMSEFFCLLLRSIEVVLAPGPTKPRQVGFRLVGCSCSHVDPVSRTSMVGFVYRPASISEFCSNLSVFYIHLVADRCPNARPTDLRKRFSLCYNRKDAGISVLRDFCEAYFRELDLVDSPGGGIIFFNHNGFKRVFENRSMSFSPLNPLPQSHDDSDQDDDEALSIQQAVASAFQSIPLSQKPPQKENGLINQNLFQKPEFQKPLEKENGLKNENLFQKPTPLTTLDTEDESRIQSDTDDGISIPECQKNTSPAPQASSPLPPKTSSASSAYKPSNPFHMPLSLSGPMASVNSEFFSPLLLSVVRSTELFELKTRTLGVRCTYCKSLDSAWNDTKIPPSVPSPPFLTIDRLSHMGLDLYRFFLYDHIEVCGDIPGNLVGFAKSSRPAMYSPTFYRERALLQRYCDCVTAHLGLQDADGSGVLLPRGGPGSAVMELEDCSFQPAANCEETAFS